MISTTVEAKMKHLFIGSLDKSTHDFNTEVFLTINSI